MQYKQHSKSRAVYMGLLVSLSSVGIVICSYFLIPTVSSESTQSTPAEQKFNGKIAFFSNANSLALDIFSMNPDGSSRTPLTDDKALNPNLLGGTFDLRPAWSPDGSKLAFVSNRDGARFQIYSMNADGSNVTKVSDNTVTDSDPAWSPDGSKIAFTRGGGCILVLGRRVGGVDLQNDDPCQLFIYSMNVDGSNRVNLSEISGFGPVWSPDGSKIAFTSYDQTFRTDIFIMNADGTNRIPVTNTLANEYVSSWSPDGTRLAFTSDRDAIVDSFEHEIYTMKIDGSDTIRLTDNQVGEFGPVFSPDGTKIAFQRGQPFGQDQNGEIFVMNANGTNQTNITNSRSEDFGPPAWQPLSAPAQVPPPAVLQFDAASYSVNESSTSLEVNVLRSGNTAEAVSVELDSADGTASDVSDYTRLFGRLGFAAGETSKSISILLNEDAFTEGTENFSLTLHDLTGNSVLANSGSATVSILDNDIGPPSANPLENTEFFVRQHYHDFLNREPDAQGLAFWVNNIESCGSNAACREIKRIDTSAAFFLSTEFEKTGFYIYRIWVGPLQRRPDFASFMRDNQEIGNDLIVGAPGWEQHLDANTQRFTEGFISRPDFRRLYPETLKAEAFVDLLYLRSGITAPPAERDEAVAAFGSGDIAGRARALRIVVNSTTFTQRLLTSGFVLEEYFGYLRRDPDFEGFDFWLKKLDSFNGDFRQAEMVKAFLVSGEYRSRFGPP